MNLELAPKKGIIYALSVHNVFFKEYNNEEELNKILDKALKDLLELHLFNEEKEYRFIKTRNKEIECVVCDDNHKNNDVYKETIYIQDKFSKEMEQKKVTIINYIDYENDLLKFINYRLKQEAR